jgi:hypothetical protein
MSTDFSSSLPGRSVTRKDSFATRPEYAGPDNP